MIDSPFWEEQRAKERTRLWSQLLLTFAEARGLTLPSDASELLALLDAPALESLVNKAVTTPDIAATELRAILTRQGH
ncbi:hypothetical protein [Myxococcus xanthus]|nr:hypothetical protein [Myxococcus xanthus]